MIKEVGDFYGQYKNGQLTKGQYDYKRAKNLKQLSRNLGGLQRFLFEGETVYETVSINRKKGISATDKITGSAIKLNELATLAKGGGVVLTGISAAIACEDIANTDNREEKNEIFFEFIGETAGSVIAGAALGIIFASTPIGWAAALVIGGATVAAGWASGEVFKLIYDSNFKGHDFVADIGVDKWCK